MKFSNLEKIRSIALVGASGMVGQEFMNILNEHKIRVPQIRLLGSSRSVGESFDYLNGRTIELLDSKSFDGIEVAFFSVPKAVTRKFIPIALEKGCLVIDDSSVYRMHSEVPLVIPQINGFLLKSFSGRLIATPNCTTTPLALCLMPLIDKYGVERVVVSTYQSVSGAGRQAYRELSEQAISLLNGSGLTAKIFPHQIAFNCLPMIGDLSQSGDSEEEDKVKKELRKILDLPHFRVSTTAVRVPTFCGHGLSVNVELQNAFSDEKEIREILDGVSGIQVIDKPDNHIYPTNLECIGSDSVYVGRIRRDSSVTNGVNFWVIADNLRKGSALNVVEILDELYSYRE